jgi:hypothetical protein
MMLIMSSWYIYLTQTLKAPYEIMKTVLTCQNNRLRRTLPEPEPVCGNRQKSQQDPALTAEQQDKTLLAKLRRLSQVHYRPR